jgi:hypothetical protein
MKKIMKKYIKQISVVVALATVFVVAPIKTQAIAAPVCVVNSYTINGSPTYAQIPSGSTATLAWSTSNCTSVNVLGVTYTDARVGSNSVTTPAITGPQIYTLNAYGISGNPTTITVTAYVGAAPSNCSITAFTINGSPTTATVPSGTPVTLAWTTSNCTSVVVNGTTYTGAAANSNSITSSPITAVQNFTLVAYNSNGTSVNKTVIANPAIVAVCGVSSFTANGTSGSITVPSGTNVNLAWSTSNCTSVTVNGVTYTGNQAWTGSTNTGALTQTISYTLTAVGANGVQKTATVTVNVTPAATCSITSFTANGTQNSITVPSGTNVLLAWSTTNCTSATVNGTTYLGNQVWSGNVYTGALTQSRTYVFTAFDNAGTQKQATVTITINQPSNCTIGSFTINGSPTTANIPSGTTATLAWSTSNCVKVNVLGVDYMGAQANAYSVTTPAITSIQNYTLNAYNNNGTFVNKTVIANPTQVQNCSISSFTVNGVTSTTVPYNTSVNLVWTTSNCDTITVLGTTYSGVQADAYHAYTGFLTNPTNNFTATANSATAGSDTKSVVVNVTAQQTNCSITSFTANGATTLSIPYNTSATLAWTTSSCDTVVVNGVTYTGGQAISGNVSTPMLTSSVNNYTLSASNSTGSSDSKSVVVNVSSQPNLCVVNSYTANGTSDFVQIPNNTSVTLLWSTSNCTSLTINGVAYTGSQISSGSYNTGSLNGTYNYILTAQSGSQYVTRTMNITTYGSSTNNNTCSIQSFSPQLSTVNSGNTTILNWTLSSGCQNYVTVSGTNMSSNQIYNGYITTGPVYGYSTYTLTAYGQNGGNVTATTYVSVNNYNNNNNQCNINYFTANGSNSVQVNQGGTATIAWSTNGCGNIIVTGPGVYSTNQSGSMQTSPIYGSSNYTITANDYNYSYNNQQTRTVYITTSTYYPPVVTPINTNPVTTVATNVSTASARLNGLIPANTGAGTVQAYFEYGTTASLGNQTNPQSVSTYTFSNYFDTISTSPNTTYYYRAVANTNGQILKGDLVSFTTPATQTTPIYVNRITYGTGTGSGFVSLSISDLNGMVSPGDTISYTVNYKNISTQDLSNVMLNVVLPTGVTYRGSTQGMPTTNNTIVASLGTLAKNAQGSINIQAVADTTLKAGSNLVSTATLSFVTANGAQDSAVAYFMNNVNGSAISAGSGLGGFAFGAGFFPTTLFGWIILIGIIILLIILARRLTDSNKNKQYQPGHAPYDPHNTPQH